MEMKIGVDDAISRAGSGEESSGHNDSGRNIQSPASRRGFDVIVTDSVPIPEFSLLSVLPPSLNLQSVLGDETYYVTGQFGDPKYLSRSRR